MQTGFSALEPFPDFNINAARLIEARRAALSTTDSIITAAVALSAPVNDANIFEVFLPVPEKRKAFISFVPNSLIEPKIFFPLSEKRPKSAADFRYSRTRGPR